MALAAALGWAAAAVAQAPLDPLPPALQSAALAAAREHGVCRVGLAWVQAGRIAAGDLAPDGLPGCSALEPGQGPLLFQAASLGKPVLAYAVLRLARQGRIDLDAPLLPRLPQGYLHLQNPFGNPSAPRTEPVTASELAAVTARQVLQHTSGLPNWAGGALGFDFAPGTRWQYSGEGFMLLQRVVEAITGQPIDALLQAEVLGPLGMVNSAWVWPPALASQLAGGTRANGQAVHHRFTQPVAAATLYTTAADYARFLAALLTDEALLQTTLAAPVPVAPDLGLAWGLGWGIEAQAGERYLWHWGNNPGYRAFVIASPARREGLVMLSNHERGLAMAPAIVQVTLPGPHPVFRFAPLRTGRLERACQWLGWC